MGKRAEEAVKKHSEGYNCAQSVACTFADLMGMDEKDVFKMSEGFGFGMGACETCGCHSFWLFDFSDFFAKVAKGKLNFAVISWDPK